MASVYPGALDSYVAKVDGPTQTIYAAHVNALQEAVVAIETELGTDPAGSAADLKTRLAAGLNADGSLKTGFSVAAGTITTLTATTVGCKVIGNHNYSNVTPLQRVMEDSATAGGNARGESAVDLQSTRGAANQVASGNHSVIAGGKANDAPTQYATVSGGWDNTASGNASVVCGGRSNTAYGQDGFVGGGNSNDATGSWAVIVGGYQNETNGHGTTICGGYLHNVTANYATACGGYDNAVSAVYAACIGGHLNAASGELSIVTAGKYGKADKYGQVAHASGRFAALGDAQTSEMVMRIQTTDVTQTALTLDGASALIGLDEDATYALEAHIVARRTDADNESAFYVLRWCVDRNTSGAAALVGAVENTLIAEDTGAWAVTADCNGNNTRILVTGENAKTIRWVARVKMTEVHG